MEKLYLYQWFGDIVISTEKSFLNASSYNRKNFEKRIVLDELDPTKENIKIMSTICALYHNASFLHHLNRCLENWDYIYMIHNKSLPLNSFVDLFNWYDKKIVAKQNELQKRHDELQNDVNDLKQIMDFISESKNHYFFTSKNHNII